MNQNINLYKLTQLAEASYANFWNSTTNSIFNTDDTRAIRVRGQAVY